MKPIIALPVLLLSGSWQLLLADEQSHELEVAATAAQATVKPVENDQRSVQLPDLSFSFQLRYRCSASYVARSLSLTVADDHRYFTADELDPESGSETVVIDVGAGQIAPVVMDPAIINASCEVSALPEPGDSSPSPPTLPSLLSAQASLRCESAASQEIVYRVVPLDVMLYCEPPAPDRQRVAKPSGGNIRR